MVWAGAESFLSRLERYAHRGWVEGSNGGLAVCHQPARAPLAYLHHTYPGLSAEAAALAQKRYGLSDAHVAFLRFSNGCNLFDCLTLNGSHLTPAGCELLRRDPSGVIGQPIDLLYANLALPVGLPAGTFGIGTITGDSAQGRLVVTPSGEVRLTHHTDGTDVAARWPDVETVLLSEFDRLAVLHDEDGEPLVDPAELPPVSAHRWEERL